MASGALTIHSSRNRFAARLNSDVRPMRTLLTLATFFFSSLSYAQVSPALASASGLWQFGEHTVWVHIEQDGSAFQCRIAPGGTVYASTGVVVAPSSIQWRKTWGVDQVSLHGDTMVLKGPYGAFKYHRTSQSMASACSASLRRSNISFKADGFAAA